MNTAIRTTASSRTTKIVRRAASPIKPGDENGNTFYNKMVTKGGEVIFAGNRDGLAYTLTGKTFVPVFEVWEDNDLMSAEEYIGLLEFREDEAHDLACAELLGLDMATYREYLAFKDDVSENFTPPSEKLAAFLNAEYHDKDVEREGRTLPTVVLTSDNEFPMTVEERAAAELAEAIADQAFDLMLERRCSI